jgi:hypothetical protein
MQSQTELEAFRVSTHLVKHFRSDRQPEHGIGWQLNHQSPTKASERQTRQLWEKPSACRLRKTDLMRLVEQSIRDPTSDHTDLATLHLRIIALYRHHMVMVLCRCRKAAACSAIVCFQVLAGPVVLVYDRLQPTPASSHTSLLLRNTLAPALRLQLTPTTESLIAVCGVFWGSLHRKAFPTFKLSFE